MGGATVKDPGGRDSVRTLNTQSRLWVSECNIEPGVGQINVIFIERFLNLLQ